MKLSGWGRFPVVETELARPRDRSGLADLIGRTGTAIARGNGRSYGDSSLGHDLTIDMRHFDRLIGFDETTGIVTTEAGLLLSDLIEIFLPRGWFPAVTPGTRYVTIGGMIAADVHGKNHHSQGTFGQTVEWLDLLTGDGRVLRCSRSENAELFALTIGGMGLTGIILAAAFRLVAVESGWIRQETRKAACLAEAMDIFEAEAHWTYSVAWIDCLAKGGDLGRSLVFLGEHAKAAELDATRAAAPFTVPDKRALSVPIDFPSFSLNSLSVRLFNALYYRQKGRETGPALVDWKSYFYPLDSIAHWNRIYGRAGFAQYQCVIPQDASRAGMSALLEAISAAGAGSFLAVLKKMGPQQGVLSFPLEGYTLALDFPANTANLALLDRLDAITLAHGGRFYLAKDSRMSARTLDVSDRRVEAFREARQKLGLAHDFASHQSRRLNL